MLERLVCSNLIVLVKVRLVTYLTKLPALQLDERLILKIVNKRGRKADPNLTRTVD